MQNIDTRLTMAVLLERLERLGIPEKFVRDFGIPDWWVAEELDDKPVAVLECSGYIAQRLGIDLGSLLKGDRARWGEYPRHVIFVNALKEYAEKYNQHKKGLFHPSSLKEYEDRVIDEGERMLDWLEDEESD